MGREPHISKERIRQFAEGDLILQPDELQHFQNCDDCSSQWWRMKLELKRKKPGKDKDKSDKEKSA